MRTLAAQISNPLTWPFLIATAAYGIGFTLFHDANGVAASSLHRSLADLATSLPVLWGIACLVALALGAWFIYGRSNAAAKAAGIVGFMVWLFAGICWVITGAWLLFFAIAIPNAWFWAWVFLQYPRA